MALCALVILAMAMTIGVFVANRNHGVPVDESESAGEQTYVTGPEISSIVDASLRKCVAAAVGDADAGSNRVRDVRTVSDLVFPVLASEHSDSCDDLSDVRSLEGIQRFTGLQNLDISSLTALEDGAPIAELHQLQQLNLAETQISNVDFLDGLTHLSQVALPASACDISVLADDESLQSVSVGCTTADISVLDGRGLQLVVPDGFPRRQIEHSAQSGNTVTVMNADGSMDIYQRSGDGIKETHM